MVTFLGSRARRQFPRQKFKEKDGKQPVSRKIYEKKLKRSLKSVKERKVGKRKT